MIPARAAGERGSLAVLAVFADSSGVAVPVMAGPLAVGGTSANARPRRRHDRRRTAARPRRGAYRSAGGAGARQARGRCPPTATPTRRSPAA